MKSALEIAMERLEKSSGPTQKLNEDQKARIAEIDNKYAAKLAEAKLGFEGRIAGAASIQELEQLKAEMAAEIRSIEERRDGEKDAVWSKE